MILIVFIASFIVALLGRNRKFGFWGYFFSSLLLSPIIGLLLVIASAEKVKEHNVLTRNCSDD
ncbi:MAG: hypothetical protein JRG71_04920 [Deltaproteobacteria bacterium]|nr:hypothetical protein [Deltaproteobacteria bacterium]